MKSYSHAKRDAAWTPIANSTTVASAVNVVRCSSTTHSPADSCRSFAVRPDQQAGDGRYAIAWLTISAPRGAVPTATSVCACGRNRFAAGHRKALALVEDHTRHRDLCLLRTHQEGAAV